MRFRDLPIGAAFDFVDDSNRVGNSFYARCTKTGAQTYTWQTRAYVKRGGEVVIEDNATLTGHVGTINVQVFHVESDS